MRSPTSARPTSGVGGAAAADDDFAFYYSFFQDPASASPLALDQAAVDEIGRAHV